jgi:hypothetical protein
VAEARDGRVVKSLGDGAMVAFGAAHDALAAAVAIQQEIELHNRTAAERLSLRIGISLGDLVHEADDLHGMAVTEAARVCAAASGGTILLTDVVRVVAGSRAPVPFQDMGRLALKGLPEPLQVWSAVWSPLPDPHPHEIPLPLAAAARVRPLAGREHELALLHEVRQKAATTGAVVLVAGEPGVGKSTLAACFAREAHEAGDLVGWGTSDELRPRPYRPWLDALRPIVAAAPPDLAASHRARHGPTIFDGSRSVEAQAWDAMLTSPDALELASARPVHRWFAAYRAASGALFDGRIGDAEVLAEAVAELGAAAGQPDAAVLHTALLANIRLQQGRVSEMTELLGATADTFPFVRTWRAAQALALLQGGQADAAHRTLTEMRRDGRSNRRDFTWMGGVALGAQVCEGLGDRHAAAELYDELRPFAGEVVYQNVAVQGSAEGFLGLLAMTLGRLDDAEAHFTRATRVNESLRAPCLVAFAQFDHARCLVRRDRPGDRERARRLCDAVAPVAEERGLDGLRRDVRALLDESRL